jgi:hypothetical protein
MQTAKSIYGEQKLINKVTLFLKGLGLKIPQIIISIFKI